MRGGQYEYELLSLAAQIHSAPLNPAIWPATIGQLTSFFRSSALTLGSAEPGGFHTFGLDESSLRAFNTHYYSICPFVRSIRAGGFWTRACQAPLHGLCRNETLDRSECYNDFYRPRNFHYGYGGTLAVYRDRVSVFTFLRPKAAGPIEGTEERGLLSLIPHLRHAARLQHELVLLQAERDTAFGDPFDSLGRAVFLIGASGCVLRMNRSALRLASIKDGISAHPDGLRGHNTRVTAELRALIQRAIQNSTQPALQPGGFLSISRPLQLRPYWCSVYSLAREAAAGLFGFPTPAAAVVVVDPEQAATPAGDAFQRLFQLTPTESRLAILLAQGTNLETAAAQLAVTRNTARTHLQHIYQKTGTQKQGELVALLARSVLLCR